MLNTLYPALVDSPPTARLTINMLMQQREGFFRYIKTVERRGTECLSAILRQGAKTGEETGWPAVKRTLNNYLNLANNLIDDCRHISTIDCVSQTPEIPAPESEDEVTEEVKKTDSGIGFGTEAKHSKNASMSSDRSASSHVSHQSHVSYTSSMSLKSQGSTLERIARELKRMKPRRLQVDEIIQTNIMLPRTYEGNESGNNTPLSAKSSKEDFKLASTPPTPTTPTASLSGRNRFGLRKMKSLGTLGDLKHNNDSATSLRNSSATPTFDLAVVKRHREAFDQQRQVHEVSVA
jgi:hypothetical protein